MAEWTVEIVIRDHEGNSLKEMETVVASDLTRDKAIELLFEIEAHNWEED